jgi:acetyl-CoA carboxylase biotin carboxyl carrier protein
MDIEKIEQLIDIVINKGISELEIHENQESWVKISNKPQNVITSATALLPHHSPMPAPQLAAAESAPAAKEEPKQHTVDSPMVGTVYLSSAPGAKHFIEIGQPVKVGDTLCLIEAMKMFNRIESDKAGTIKARLIENGQPVEYGQPLFVIE